MAWGDPHRAADAGRRLDDLVEAAGDIGSVREGRVEADGGHPVVHQHALGAGRGGGCLGKANPEPTWPPLLVSVTDEFQRGRGLVVVGDHDSNRIDREPVEAGIAARGAEHQRARAEVLDQAIVHCGEADRLERGPVLGREHERFAAADAAVVDRELAVARGERHHHVRGRLGGQAQVDEAVAGPRDAALLQFHEHPGGVVVANHEVQAAGRRNRVETIAAGRAAENLHVLVAVHEAVVVGHDPEGLAGLPIFRSEGEGDPGGCGGGVTPRNLQPGLARVVGLEIHRHRVVRLAREAHVADQAVALFHQGLAGSIDGPIPLPIQGKEQAGHVVVGDRERRNLGHRQAGGEAHQWRGRGDHVEIAAPLLRRNCHGRIGLAALEREAVDEHERDGLLGRLRDIDQPGAGGQFDAAAIGRLEGQRREVAALARGRIGGERPRDREGHAPVHDLIELAVGTGHQIHDRTAQAGSRRFVYPGEGAAEAGRAVSMHGRSLAETELGDGRRLCAAGGRALAEVEYLTCRQRHVLAVGDAERDGQLTHAVCAIALAGHHQLDAAATQQPDGQSLVAFSDRVVDAADRDGGRTAALGDQQVKPIHAAEGLGRHRVRYAFGVVARRTLPVESHRRLGGIERLVVETERDEVAPVELEQVGAPDGPSVDHLIDHGLASETESHAALRRNAEAVKAGLGDGDVARPGGAEVAGLAVGGEGGPRLIDAVEVDAGRLAGAVEVESSQASEGLGVLAGADRKIAGEQLPVALLEIEKDERVPLRRGGQRDRELGRVMTGFRDPALRRCRDYGKGRRAALAGGLVVFDGQRVVVEDDHREARSQLGVGPVAARDLERELPSDVAIHAAVIDALQEQLLHFVPGGGCEHQVESRSARLAWSAHPDIAARAEAQADIARRAAREPDAKSGLSVGGLVGLADSELAGARPARARGVEVAPSCQKFDVRRVVVGQFGRAGARHAADAVAAAVHQAHRQRLDALCRQVVEHDERHVHARAADRQEPGVDRRRGEAGGSARAAAQHGRRFANGVGQRVVQRQADDHAVAPRGLDEHRCLNLLLAAGLIPDGHAPHGTAQSARPRAAVPDDRAADRVARPLDPSGRAGRKRLLRDTFAVDIQARHAVAIDAVGQVVPFAERHRSRPYQVSQHGSAGTANLQPGFAGEPSKTQRDSIPAVRG